MVQNSYYLVRAIARESVQKVSVPTYIQNRTHDESMMTNVVSCTTTDRGMEMYRKCRGDNENMGGEGY